MRPVVFLGPSLSHDEARFLIDADLRPPVKRGDLPQLPEDTEVVAIIDGVFLGEAAVGHREILDLLRSGKQVWGSSSMGALRAAELRTFGMKGVGDVYEAYATGKVEGDDEVALAFDPDSLEALSEPLINVRLNLKAVVEQGILSEEESRHVLDQFKALYFPRRNLMALSLLVKESVDAKKTSDFETFLSMSYVDFKKKDAIDLLEILRGRKRASKTDK